MTKPYKQLGQLTLIQRCENIMAKSTLDKRRLTRAAEHKRDMLLQKKDSTTAELAKARLELARVRKLK